MNLNSIPALGDNYIWTLDDNAGQCLIVDPGEAAPVIAAMEQHQWTPAAILLTHHHHDHVGGVKKLLNKWPNLVVYGPQETQDKGATHIISDGDIVPVLGCEFSVIFTPGHTLGHVLYYSYPYLFCGDTLFSGGCGRLFEGTAEQMYQSFQKLAELPDDTLICCAHEYTLSNLKFANAILPQDLEIQRYYQKIKELRAKNHSSLPSKLGCERRINLFLRTQDADLKRALGLNMPPQHAWDVFALLRQKKDDF
ncbi:hydroxyacylglutathione hydrolase [Mixta tenebrionis]|uniref:Hydroxyacylglutathione hydrolase n=1 Tax=Mixta tenebrionis TaxID=2562439 RepID=A0A506V7I4_9GAMM|nr:hydroxyacylglutathione hydrolase [Mixta tenebrionis]TPW41496.1 hydroxyacylglutathione hydrolase [Mixta tenebrionis]